MKIITYLFLLCIINFHGNAQTSQYLDKNRVKARILTTNDKFWNLGGNSAASYEVPKGGGRHTMYANSIWIGGFDASGLLHMAANTYKQSGSDLWFGPLDTTSISVFTPSLITPYNRLWKV